MNLRTSALVILVLALTGAFGSIAGAQTTPGSVPPAVHDRARGEASPGTNAPSQAAIMRVAQSGTSEALFSTLEYGERVECHACVPVLENRILTDADPRAREIAAWWLRRRPFAVGAVLANLRRVAAEDSDAVRRARAVEALGEMMDTTSIPALTTAASSDAAVSVRAASVRALARINAPASHAPIVAAMGDADATVREAAVSVVLRVNFFRNHAAVVALLSDSSPAIRRRAARALGAHRVADSTATLALLLASDTDPSVRQAAAWSLGRVGGTEAQSALAAAATREQDSLVLDAIEVAMQMR